MHVINDTHASEHARLDTALVVVYFDRYLEGAGLGIDYRAHARDFGNGPLAAQRIDIDSDRLPFADLPIFAFRDMQVGNQRIEAGDTKCGLAGLDRVAYLDVAFGHDAVDRGTNLCVVEFEAGEIERGLERFQVIAQFFVFALGEQAFLAQLLVAGHVASHLLQASARLVEFQAQAIAVQAGEHIAVLHDIPFLEQYFADFSGDLGDDVRFRVGFDRCRARVNGIDVAAGGVAGLDRDRRNFFFLFFFLFGLSALLTRGQQQGAGERCRANTV